MRWRIATAMPVLAAAFLTIGGCSELPPKTPVSVDTLDENLHAWNGQIVKVHGWLGKCQKLECSIYNVDLPGFDGIEFYLLSHKEEFAEKHISVGYVDEFDRKAHQYLYKHVVIKARVNCPYPNFIQNCRIGMDRIDLITPIDIRPYWPNFTH